MMHRRLPRDGGVLFYKTSVAFLYKLHIDK